jgi:hypothetical protein
VGVGVVVGVGVGAVNFWHPIESAATTISHRKLCIVLSDLLSGRLAAFKVHTYLLSAFSHPFLTPPSRLAGAWRRILQHT